jgi:hypothetical protein
VERVERHLAADDHVAGLGLDGVGDLGTRRAFHPCAGAPVRLHLHLNPAQTFGVRASRLQLRKAELEGLERRIERASSGGVKSRTPNPSVAARHVGGIFFPHRPSLRLTAHNHSPSVLRKILCASARETSFQGAAFALEQLAEVTLSSRNLSRIAHEVGQQLQTQRDQDVERLEARELEPRIETRPALAVIEVDGGRLQVRGEGKGPGAHDASWREDKIALLATAKIAPSDSDPEPDLPACFLDRHYVEELMRGMGGIGSMSDSGSAAAADTHLRAAASDSQDEEARKRPELLVRTYVASTCSSDEFGPMVAAEATRRNFTNAAHQVFLGDGAAWIWKLQKQYFPTFEAIVDFLHVLTHVFTAAKVATSDAARRWALFQAWAEACWQGRVGWVIDQITALQATLGPLPDGALEELPDDDPGTILSQVARYLEHNRSRMDYPRCRRQGLPWTSSHVESTVKLFNRRVKGSEKFWGQPGAESILQFRAAYVSEDERLTRHLKSRPCTPFRTYKTRKNRKAA